MSNPEPTLAARGLARIGPWLVPVAILAGWQLAAQLGWLSTRILPAPSAVLAAGWSLAASGELLTHMQASFARAAIGFAIGGGIGFFFGLMNGCYRLAENLFDTTLQMVRNVPHLALIPLVILWFGIGEEGKLFLVALGVFFPVYLNTFHGIRSVDAALVEMGRSYGLSGWSLFRHVILPGALPNILVGVRYSLGFMWLTLIVAETIAASSGIGYMAMNAREFLQTDVVVLAILLYAVLGKAADVAALAEVGLADRAGEWPSRLSGGQRQRVALARALVHKPRLLLLDEPLGALDALTRIEMHALIERLWQTQGFTALLVTHDVSEAVALADRVLLIEDGTLALDQRVDLTRPRDRSSPRFTRMEDEVLRRVLQHPPIEDRPQAPSAPFGAWRWAA
ncbi:aliphatic sulfonate ABC transporter permease SsuC [Thauera sp.]|uniref:aliphatic sulfonate ABC transporter permease SsuC n=1 Tax=Thauera sp. TaxID=1905334 RepID=UPI002B9BDD40|nr:aliphatic sulfonate ABC transporter permease SsuC [Thauera sp.]HRP24388.1 aliphatic sulfonate ABC transporter permease SsuC [Thauera sp.]